MAWIWTDKSVLITGVTGTLGTALCKRLLRDGDAPARLVGISRKWQDQDRLREELGNDERLRLFIGDVRDLERLRIAMRGINLVIHTAAIKGVQACEYDVTEALLTNCIGTLNVLQAAMEKGAEKVIVISSDKSVSPISSYGATKKMAEHLAVSYNAYSGATGTRFSACRYGNVVGSQGSVIPLFLKQKGSGVLTITNPDMTRFWITINEAVEFVLHCLENMVGGEIFVPHLPSARVTDIATAVSPDAEQRIVGVRPGEKIHEAMIIPEESYRTRDFGWAYKIEPEFHPWVRDYPTGGSPIKDGLLYTSASNTMLSPDSIRRMLEK